MNLMRMEEILKQESGFNRHYLMLYSLVVGLECDWVLEFGAGLSTSAILFALEENNKGSLLTIDYRPEPKTVPYLKPEEKGRLTYVRKNFKDALESINSHAYDLVLHDGTHEVGEVKEELKVIIPRIKYNGLLLIHDTLCQDVGIAYYLTNLVGKEFATSLPGKMEYMTLPYGYGLTIARIRQDFGHGEVDPVWRKTSTKIWDKKSSTK